MHLITMAHLGEAQSVIELFGLKRHSSQLFENGQITCLITGEGPFEAATRAAAVLGQKKFESVINLGIAGSLSTEHKVGDIHPVRSVYLAIEGKPQFKSFRSCGTGLDCLTSFERILTPEKASILRGIADLVDREAWGVAMAAKNLSVPFTSFKLISDQAGSLGACELSREMAQEWSEKLALYLKEILSQAPSQEKSLLHIPGFHLTFSTRHQLEQMLKKISLRDGIGPEAVLAGLPLEKIKEEISQSKERTRILLDHLEGHLDPLKTLLKTGLDKFKHPFERVGIQISHDPNWESPELKVSFSVATNEELKLKLETLKKLDLAPFQDLRNGSAHVE